MLILAGILLVGLALRVSYLHELRQSPGFDTPTLDPGFNNYWARAMATGDWTPPAPDPDPLIRVTPYLRPPGYAYFLASAYRAFGLSYLAPRLVQLILGLENCLLAFALARRWFGSGAGLITAALMATYWILVYFEGQFQEPTLLIFVLLAFVYVLSMWTQRRALRYALAAGLLLGLAGTVRPNPLLFLPVGVAWACWIAHRRGERWPVFAKAAAGLVAGGVIAVAPITIRNYRVAGDFVLISANGGLNLYIGNNEFADGQQLGHLPDTGWPAMCFTYPQVVREVQREQGRAMRYSEVSAYFVEKALRFIREHPAAFATLTLKRAALFWGPQEIPLNEEMDCERAFSRTLRDIPGNFPALLALCLLGAACLVRDLRSEGRKAVGADEVVRRKEVAVLLGAFVMTFFLSYVFFFNAASYRTPILPFLMIFGAYGLWRVGQLVWNREIRRAASWAAAGLFLFLLVRMPIVSCPTPGPVAWHCRRGSEYARKGQLDRAIEEGRAALKADPQSPRPHELMAMWLTKQGLLSEASQHEQMAAELRNATNAEPDARALKP